MASREQTRHLGQTLGADSPESGRRGEMLGKRPARNAMLMGRQWLCIASALLLTGCAAPRVGVFKEVQSNSWQPGKGPLVSELVRMPQATIKEVALRTSAPLAPRDKFESDAEFNARKQARNRPVFLAVPFKTTKEDSCESTYDRESQTYKIASCMPLFAARVVHSENTQGTPFTLANAYDSRTIQTNIWTTYRVLVSVDWQAEYKLPIDEAKAMDSDLVVGIVLDAPTTTHACGLCQQRKSNDALRKLSSAMGNRSSSNGWRDEAFRSGELLEPWEYVTATGGFSRVVIFRKSDQRVLSDRTFARVAQ